MVFDYLVFLIKRAFRSNKRILSCIFVIFSLQLFFKAITQNKNKNFQQRDVNQPNILNDTLVITSNYLNDYNASQLRWHELVIKSDEENSYNKKKLLNERAKESIYKREYIILEYTKFMGETKYCQYFDNYDRDVAIQNTFIKECPYTNCRFSCDKSLVNKADVLLFHESDLKKELKRQTNYYETLMTSSNNRENGQLWVIWNDEANPVQNDLDKFKFNWTISYRHDAEVSDCSYGCIYTNGKKSINKMSNEYKEKIRELKTEFLRRKRQALSFISNCDPQLRLKFASDLKDHFPVKAQGRCAKYIYSKQESFIVNFFKNLFESNCGRDSSCESREYGQSLFYLSFESKNCSNYLTEKLYKILNTHMIPVVFQPAKIFYELSAPPNSFIHAEDFDYDPTKLADYLIQVSNDFSLYVKHQIWKINYSVVFTGKKVENRRLCQFCTRLNTETSKIYYENISEWFNKNCIVN